MPPHDLPAGRADGPGRIHKLAVFKPQGMGADDSCNVCPVDQGQGQKHVHDASAQGIHDHHGQQHGRKGQGHVGDSHDHRVGQPALIPGQHAKGRAQQEAEQRGHHADEQGNPRPKEQAGQHVPAALVGAQQVLGRRSRQPVHQIHLLFGVGGEQGREHRRQGHQHDHNKGKNGGFVFPRHAAHQIPKTLFFADLAFQPDIGDFIHLFPLFVKQPSPLLPDPGIQHGVQAVRQQAADDHHGGRQQRSALQKRNIPA